MQVAFELTGEMPLLMHADDVEECDALSRWRKDPENSGISVPGDDRSPAWTWQTYLYSDGENVTIPSHNLMIALRSAGAKMILKKQKTFKEVTQSGLLILSEFCDFKCAGETISMDSIRAMRDMPFSKQAEAVRELGFKLFVKRACVPAGSNKKHVRVRARFDEWTLSGVVAVSAPEISFEKLIQLFDLAGRVGLGDWRPGCKTPGPYGMFTTKLKKL